MVVIVNGNFGTLPTVSRSGYTFDGWYTQNGYRVGPGVQYLGHYDRVYAQWTANTPAPQPTPPPPQPNTKTVYFDPNGGNAPSFSSMQVTVDGRFDPMPTVTRSGYIFEGWYTQNGSIVTHNTKYLGTYDVVYAHWRKQ